MALPCNGFEDQTVPVTQQEVECAQICDDQLEIDDPTFYLLVIDALDRAGVTVDSLEPSDLRDATKNAMCSLNGRAITSVDPMKAKAYIIAQLNNLLCA